GDVASPPRAAADIASNAKELLKNCITASGLHDGRLPLLHNTPRRTAGTIAPCGGRRRPGTIATAGGTRIGRREVQAALQTPPASGPAAVVSAGFAGSRRQTTNSSPRANQVGKPQAKVRSPSALPVSPLEVRGPVRSRTGSKTRSQASRRST